MWQETEWLPWRVLFTSCYVEWPSREWDGWGMHDVWQRWETHTKFWFENLKGSGNTGDLGVDGKRADVGNRTGECGLYSLVSDGVLGCNAMRSSRYIPTFSRNMLFPFSGPKSARRYNLGDQHNVFTVVRISNLILNHMVPDRDRWWAVVRTMWEMSWPAERQ